MRGRMGLVTVLAAQHNLHIENGTCAQVGQHKSPVVCAHLPSLEATQHNEWGSVI